MFRHARLDNRALPLLEVQHVFEVCCVVLGRKCFRSIELPCCDCESSGWNAHGFLYPFAFFARGG